MTGQAILDFGGAYPQPFESRTTRRTLFGQATYRVTGDLHISGGGRFEKEAGYSDPDADPDQTRKNGGAFVEGRGSIGGRTHISAGVGVEHNAAFETATTPRLSIASYLRNPARGAVGDTKLVLNFGKGIKAMSIFQQQSSLFALLESVANAPAVDPLGPERSTSFDLGVEQGFADGRARVRVSYFRNSFEDLIEYVSRATLPLVGVPPAVAAATAFGAYVNSSSFDSQGLETSAEAALGPVASDGVLHLPRRRSDRVLQRRRAGAGHQPGVPRRSDRPVLAARRRAAIPAAGALWIVHGRLPERAVRRGAVGVSLGPARRQHVPERRLLRLFLLLPNQDLEAGYQKVDLAAGYRVHRSFRVFTSIENLFDQDYQASYGFPALPITARFGVTVNVGGR